MATRSNSSAVTMSWKYLTLTVAVLLAAAYQAAHASVIEKPNQHIKILREIATPDFDEVKRRVGQTQREAKSKNLEVRPPFVYLDTPGGSLSEAIAIGRLLRKEQASAQIEWDGICYSACVIVLAGAVHRYIEGQVGIHRPYFNDVPKGEISPDKISETLKSTLQELRAYFGEMNVNEQLADAMLRIEPEHVRLLSSSELNSFGLTMIDPIAHEVEELKKAQSLGVSRQEYMRRKALAEARCADPSTICARRIFQTGKVDPNVPPDKWDIESYGTPVKEIAAPTSR
jgi:ATP-dependent protease ClpP protease subunit